MKHLVVATSVLALSGILTGCSSLPMPDSTEFTEAGRSYQFQTTQSTMRFANASPLELKEGSETTRVLALFGMPDFQAVKPGDFSNFLFTTSDMGITQHYIAPAVSQRPEKSGPTNTDFAAVSVNALSGTGMGAGAVGAAGAALMIAGTDTSQIREPWLEQQFAIGQFLSSPISRKPMLNASIVLRKTWPKRLAQMLS